MSAYSKYFHWMIPIFMFQFAACAGVPQGDEGTDHSVVMSMSFSVDTLATGLENPWGMAFLPGGDILITERPGRLRVFRDGKLLANPIKGLPEIWANGQGGLLDIALHPLYEENGWIYLAYARRGNGDRGNTAISRIRIVDDAVSEHELLFHGEPHTVGGVHFGSRMVFDSQGYLYFAIGDRGVMDNAQRKDNHNGKVLRIRDDGSVPDDNPFVDEEGAMPELWTLGNRNIQGMDIHPVTGEIWAHEHGPRGGDEINIIRRGRNYGWPLVTHGINYNGTIITEHTTMEGMEDPVLDWTPSIAPCGMTFVRGDRYPAWTHNILAGALAGTHIHRVVLEGNEVVYTEKLLVDMARFRDIRMGPDGLIYVLTEMPGLFFRIIPEG